MTTVAEQLEAKAKEIEEKAEAEIAAYTIQARAKAATEAQAIRTHIAAGGAHLSLEFAELRANAATWLEKEKAEVEAKWAQLKAWL